MFNFSQSPRTQSIAAIPQSAPVNKKRTPPSQSGQNSRNGRWPLACFAHCCGLLFLRLIAKKKMVRFFQQLSRGVPTSGCPGGRAARGVSPPWAAGRVAMSGVIAALSPPRARRQLGLALPRWGGGMDIIKSIIKTALGEMTNLF